MMYHYIKLLCINTLLKSLIVQIKKGTTFKLELNDQNEIESIGIVNVQDNFSREDPQ